MRFAGPILSKVGVGTGTLVGATAGAAAAAAGTVVTEAGNSLLESAGVVATKGQMLLSGSMDIERWSRRKRVSVGWLAA